MIFNPVNATKESSLKFERLQTYNLDRDRMPLTPTLYEQMENLGQYYVIFDCKYIPFGENSLEELYKNQWHTKLPSEFIKEVSNECLIYIPFSTIPIINSVIDPFGDTGLTFNNIAYSDVRYFIGYYWATTSLHINWRDASSPISTTLYISYNVAVGDMNPSLSMCFNEIYTAKLIL